MKRIAYDLIAEQEDYYLWYRASRCILCGLITRLVTRGSDVIDFGAGTGGTASALTQAGYRVVAVDLSEVALEALSETKLANRRSEKRTASGGIRRLCAGGRCIGARKRRSGITDFISPRASAQGVLVVTVPAYEFLWSGEDYVSEHVRRYTRAGLKRQLRLAGFNRMWCYFNTLLFPGDCAGDAQQKAFVPK